MHAGQPGLGVGEAAWEAAILVQHHAALLPPDGHGLALRGGHAVGVPAIAGAEACLRQSAAGGDDRRFKQHAAGAGGRQGAQHGHWLDRMDELAAIHDEAGLPGGLGQAGGVGGAAQPPGARRVEVGRAGEGGRIGGAACRQDRIGEGLQLQRRRSGPQRGLRLRRRDGVGHMHAPGAGGTAEE